MNSRLLSPVDPPIVLVLVLVVVFDQRTFFVRGVASTSPRLIHAFIPVTAKARYENEDEDEHDRRNASTFVVLTVATEIVG
jgi:hypothetical protein